MPLRKCPACARYSLKDTCPSCGAKAIEPGPAKYSPEDHYGKYRRALKKEARERAAKR
ncbi:MAG TPA: RNA-protein complex protein Nop10 [Candidatus Thermoplasmatota archaeon]|jgi:H/ACA ribonucleoprotein complex subunit 3|nr:RNA-protein complex protein Nop10 [Candidatus Thermoplasmatota archaeon]